MSNFSLEDLPLPLQEKAQELGLEVEDVEEQFVRGSGKGGQKINKTSNCVVLRHVPTGVEVRCQKHREQIRNRLSAYKLLILKVEDLVKGEESELAKKAHKLRKQKQRRTRRAKLKMLEEKRQRGVVKELRRPVKEDD